MTFPSPHSGESLPSGSCSNTSRKAPPLGIGARRRGHLHAACPQLAIDRTVRAGRMDMHPPQFAGAAQHGIKSLRAVSAHMRGRPPGHIARDKSQIDSGRRHLAGIVQRDKLMRAWPQQIGDCGRGLTGFNPRWRRIPARWFSISCIHSARTGKTVPACRLSGRRLRGSSAALWPERESPR